MVYHVEVVQKTDTEISRKSESPSRSRRVSRSRWAQKELSSAPKASRSPSKPKSSPPPRSRSVSAHSSNGGSQTNERAGSSNREDGHRSGVERYGTNPYWRYG